jgi:hypothetical protein
VKYVYIYIGRVASCFRNRRVKYFHKYIVEYVVIVVASCPGIGGLNISVSAL